MNKILIRGAFLIAVLVCAFYAFNAYIYNEKQGDVNIENNTATIPTQPDAEPMPQIIDKADFPELGVSFTYYRGTLGYVMELGGEEMSIDPDFIKGYILTLESDKKELEQSTAPREGPPTIQLRVYKNTLKQSPSVWAMKHPLESNIELAIGEEKEAVVGGANAVLYKADGLYASDVYVVAHDSKIYVFTGAYSDASSPIVTDFNNLIQSVRFINVVR